MLSLTIIVLLVISIAVSKSQPLIASIMDILVALILLFARVIPGTADWLDWIIMVLLFLGGIAFFIQYRSQART